MKNRLLLLCTLFILSNASVAKEISGVQIPESASVAGVQLHLNGAGIRSKFFFSIYIGSLYLSEKISTVDKILANDKPKRVVMNILYKELTAEKITGAWQDGFQANNTKEQYAALEARLKTFNGFFKTSKKGDVIVLDYVPEKGTSVSINGQKQGGVPGHDFNIALLKVWLGESPADSNLKEAMLGQDQ